MSLHVSNEKLLKTFVVLVLLAAGVLLAMYVTHHATFITDTTTIGIPQYYRITDQHQSSPLNSVLAQDSSSSRGAKTSHAPPEGNHVVHNELTKTAEGVEQELVIRNKVSLTDSDTVIHTLKSDTSQTVVPSYDRQQQRTIAPTANFACPKSFNDHSNSQAPLYTDSREIVGGSLTTKADDIISPSNSTVTQTHLHVQSTGSDGRAKLKLKMKMKGNVSVNTTNANLCNGSFSCTTKAVDGYRGDHDSQIALNKHHDKESSLSTKTLRDGYQADQHNVDLVYFNMTISQRKKFQQAQVSKFCSKYHLNGARLVLPRDKSPAQHVLFRHLLVNDKTKTLFCFAPKVGCTNLKLLFFTSQGIIPKEELLKSRDHVNQLRLEEAMSQQSLYHRPKRKRLHILRNYFKFVMMRNPLERLVSGYRSKVLRYPLVGLQSHEPHYNWFRRKIFSFTHPEEYKKWVELKGVCPVNISFSDFIDFWLADGRVFSINTDEHFQPIVSLCQPCRIRYSYYGNFKTFDRDANVLMSAIGANEELLRHGYYDDSESVPTKDLMKGLYSMLNVRQRIGIIRQLSKELDFYYHLFPSERDCHKSILGINVDLLEPFDQDNAH